MGFPEDVRRGGIGPRLPPIDSVTDTFIYGRRPVWEALSAGQRPMQKLWLAQGSHGEGFQQVVDLAKQRGIPFQWVSRRYLDQRVPAGHHQGILAEIAPLAYVELELWLERIRGLPNTMAVLLDELTDPQNVGAILRSAACFGVNGIVIPRWRSAGVTPVVLRIASGAAEHTPVIRVANLQHACERLKATGFWLLGGDPAGRPCWTVDFKRPIALVIGSEGQGLRRLIKARCDELVGIPLSGRVASLNAATAAAILLYEITRQREDRSALDRQR